MTYNVRGPAQLTLSSTTHIFILTTNKFVRRIHTEVDLVEQRERCASNSDGWDGSGQRPGTKVLNLLKSIVVLATPRQSGL